MTSMRVLVLATSRKTRGGITAVLNLYEQSPMWRQYHCRWIGTHRDGNSLRKVWYLIKAMAQYLILLPFYDIIHIHFSLASSARRKFPFFKLARAFHKKTVIHLHCGSQIDAIWSPVYQKMFEQCDRGIVLSESLKTKVEEKVGLTDKVKVIYNPCPIIQNRSFHEKQDMILYSGTLYEGKGYRDLIMAFAKVAKSHPGWKLVLAGNGETDLARELADSSGFGSQVVLTGWIDGELKHRLFCEARALCLPSYAEGFPMAVLDAWAYGLPVVTTPVGGIPDVAVDGDNMLLFNPGDIERLANNLERVITDPALRNKLSEGSRNLVNGQFSLESVTNKVADVYDSIGH